MRDPWIQAASSSRNPGLREKIEKKSESFPIISSDFCYTAQAECPKHGVATTSHHDATLVATNTSPVTALMGYWVRATSPETN